MTLVVWMLGLLIAAGAGYAAWRGHAQWEERKRAAEARMASFLAQMQPAVPPQAAAAAPAKAAVEDRLLFEAAAKTAQAGEPVLAIQLYARLLSRYPQSPLAAQARSAVAEQKTRLAKG